MQTILSLPQLSICDLYLALDFGSNIMWYRVTQTINAAPNITVFKAINTLTQKTVLMVLIQNDEVLDAANKIVRLYGEFGSRAYQRVGAFNEALVELSYVEHLSMNTYSFCQALRKEFDDVDTSNSESI